MPYVFNPFTGTFAVSPSPVVAPYYIPTGTTVLIPVNDQVLFAVIIDSDGFIDVEGLLIEV